MQDINTWLTISALFATGLSGNLFRQLYWRRKFRHSERGRLEMGTRFRDLETRVNTLQLETLDARLNPRLFKNVLNSVQSHVFQTCFALDRLVHVLDYILYESMNGLVSSSEQIGFALNFIKINKIKVRPLCQLNVKTRLQENDPLLSQKVLAPMVSADRIENTDKGNAILFFDRIEHIYTSPADSCDKKAVLQSERELTLKNISFGKLNEILPEDRFCRINKAELIEMRNVQFFSHDQITSALLRNGKPLIFTLSSAFRNDFLEKVRL